MRELTSTVTVDRSDRLRSFPDTRHERDRTIHLRFLRAADGYLVQTWGSAFPRDGGGHQGRVLLGASTVAAGIDALRARWRSELLDHAEPGARPFVDGWDLAGRDVDATALSLARAGHDLFSLLFRNGDAGLDAVRDLLLAAMRAGEQVVTVESDDLVVPWGLLYVPLDDHESVWDDDYRWDPRGFWGYRHLVEHRSSRSPGFDSRIAHIDGGADHPPTPCVEQVTGFFSARATTTVPTREAELAAALRGEDFADAVVYFGCHGQVGDDRRACLVPGDGQAVRGTEVADRRSTGHVSRPVVFVGACPAGRSASAFHPAARHHLLHRGARCVIAPQVEPPRAFAHEYATRLFDAFLVPGAGLGDVVRDLARAFLDEHHNPLGLIFSLHHG